MDQIAINEIEGELSKIFAICYHMDRLYVERSPNLNGIQEEYQNTRALVQGMGERFRRDPNREANALYWKFIIYRNMFQRRDREWSHARPNYPLNRAENYEWFQYGRQATEIANAFREFRRLTNEMQDIPMLERDREPFFRGIDRNEDTTNLVFSHTVARTQNNNTLYEGIARYWPQEPEPVYEEMPANGRTNSAEAECSICGENIDPSTNTDYIRTACRHKFHVMCLNRWLRHLFELQRNSTCPNCRRSLG